MSPGPIIDRLRLFLVESPIRMARAQGVGSVRGSVKRVLIELTTRCGITGTNEIYMRVCVVPHLMTPIYLTLYYLGMSFRIFTYNEKCRMNAVLR